jgi:hypothetical protein
MKNSNRNFGIVFFCFFVILGLWPKLNNENINLLFILISFIFLILGILNSKILQLPNKYWTKFGILLGKFISPIVMTIIYFFVVTPIGLLLRIFGKDILKLKKNLNKTYWIKKVKTDTDMKKQF